MRMIESSKTLHAVFLPEDCSSSEASSNACCPAAANLSPLRGAVSAAPKRSELRQPGASPERSAVRRAGRQAVLRFDGRRKAGPKGTAARKQLRLHRGRLGGNDTHWSEGGGRCAKT